MFVDLEISQVHMTWVWHVYQIQGMWVWQTCQTQTMWTWNACQAKQRGSGILARPKYCVSGKLVSNPSNVDLICLPNQSNVLQSCSQLVIFCATSNNKKNKNSVGPLAFWNLMGDVSRCVDHCSYQHKHFYLVLHHSFQRYLEFNFILLEMILILWLALYLKYRSTENLHVGQCHCCYYALYL